MPRKLKLCQKKRYYLKPLSLVVSIPRSLTSFIDVPSIPPSDVPPLPPSDVPSIPPSLPMSDAYSVSSPEIRLPHSLTVSLPLSTYTFGILESLKCLEVRIQRAGLLPKGISIFQWFEIVYLLFIV